MVYCIIATQPSPPLNYGICFWFKLCSYCPKWEIIYYYFGYFIMAVVRWEDEIKESWWRKKLGFGQKEWRREEVQLDREKTDEKADETCRRYTSSGKCRPTLLPGEAGSWGLWALCRRSIVKSFSIQLSAVKIYWGVVQMRWWQNRYYDALVKRKKMRQATGRKEIRNKQALKAKRNEEKERSRVEEMEIHKLYQP